MLLAMIGGGQRPAIGQMEIRPVTMTFMVGVMKVQCSPATWREAIDRG